MNASFYMGTPQRCHSSTMKSSGLPFGGFSLSKRRFFRRTVGFGCGEAEDMRYMSVQHRMSHSPFTVFTNFMFQLNVPPKPLQSDDVAKYCLVADSSVNLSYECCRNCIGIYLNNAICLANNTGIGVVLRYLL